MNYNVIELFAGAGGLALGLVEIDKWAVETLRYNRPNWNIVNKDLSFKKYEGFETLII